MQDNMTKKHKIFIMSAIFSFFACGVALAILLSNVLFRPVSSNNLNAVTSPNFEVHFIALNKSQIEANANSLCQDYQKLGAGGYVWQVGAYYHILSSGFENRSDAELVQNNLLKTHGISSELISIKFQSFKLNGNFTADNKKILEKAVNSFFDAYKSLYDIAISLDTQVTNVLEARLAVNSVCTRISNIYADYQTVFARDKSLAKLNSYLEKEVDTSSKLASETLISPTQTYASLVKYRYIELLKCYYDLANELK